MLKFVATLAMTGLPNFECNVQGNMLLVPPVAAKDVCAQIAARTAHVRAHAGPVRIAVRFTRAGVASAQITRVVADRAERVPDVSIATSDTAMTMQTVEMLADEIAEMLAAR